jgi:hypothetical protein
VVIRHLGDCPVTKADIVAANTKIHGCEIGKTIANYPDDNDTDDHDKSYQGSDKSDKELVNPQMMIHSHPQATMMTTVMMRAQ